MERECYEEEVQPYRKTDHKPIIYIYIYILFIFISFNIFFSAQFAQDVRSLILDNVTHEAAYYEHFTVTPLSGPAPLRDQRGGGVHISAIGTDDFIVSITL